MRDIGQVKVFWLWQYTVLGNGEWVFVGRYYAPCTLLYRILYRGVECYAGISLPQTTQIGRRVHLWHHGGMILMPISIGDDVHLRQNTTLGVAHRNDALAETRA